MLATEMNWNEIIDIITGNKVGFIIAMFSTIYAIYQGLDSKAMANDLRRQAEESKKMADNLRKQEIDAKAMADDLRKQGEDSKEMAAGLKAQTATLMEQMTTLKDISESLTTKYLGQYPFFVNEIIELLGRAKHEILIVCDYPCYSYFTEHAKWVKYSEVIRRKALPTEEESSCTVTIKFLNEEKRRSLLGMQFRYDPKKPEEWKKRDGVTKKLGQLLHQERSKLTTETVKFSELLDIVEDAHKGAMSSYFRDAELFETSNSLPMYYWIIDDKEAIFSIPSFSDTDKEKGFRSSDTDLIEALKKAQKVLEWQQVALK